MTSALKLLSIVWQSGKKDSWERINHAMRNALELAIGSGLTFKASDFEYIAKNFRWGYWVSDEPEWIYTDAIVNGNTSCVEAWEEYMGREPFRANKVSVPRYSSPYLHTHSITRERERVGIRMGFPMSGRQWWVTGFAADRIKLASYAGTHQEGKPQKLIQFTAEEFRAAHPSKKKAKPAITQP